ncbi:hypothetical protein T8K17_00020 [Thalassobaculum sp. OXR-137]|uniref:hypothetical protein n=1 Tax=Thalassobaculum sp. OXR-137 TaxID=3100173 RepID=UPI002AC91B62|nr:hypothetical protein [Thalassobaculum sp. OXR-137]WPZ34532.1 hypothetical protein T8K17_00020 [Thalassobaculum sp. OXR-137]
MPKARRKRKEITPHESYIFRIEDWEPSYSFSLNTFRLSRGSYSEHLRVTLHGVFLAPKKAQDRRASLTILASRDEAKALEDSVEYAKPPLAVGSLTIRGAYTEYLGSMPFDALLGLTQWLSAGKIKMLDLYGDALYRGKALIRSMRFARDIDPEDW